jgi:hypothetical protein
MAIETPRIDDAEAANMADRINVLLAKMGYPDGQGTQWWLHVTHERLGGLTAMQAWQRGHQKQVFDLVEAYVSEQFAHALSSKPDVVERLLNPRAS